MSATNCACPCPDPTVTEIPGAVGATGADGADGTNGVNAFTTLTTGFNLPGAPGVAGLQAFGVTSWMSENQVIIISDPNGTDYAHFQVNSIPNGTQANLTWLDYPGDAVLGTPLAALSTVSPAGLIPVFSPPANLTDSTTGTPGATLAAGVGISTLIHPLTSLVTGLGALAIDLLTGYVPGYRFKILALDFITTVAGTGAGASQVFNLEIGATNVTGGVCTVTLASTVAIGQLTSGTLVTAANVGTAADAISLEMAAGGTVFTAGAGYFLVKIQNMDTADAAASLNASINAINATL